ncbi:hypothetical protein Scel_10000 [Streptomyces cellostaticus]|nr:hypothetical protein Scel_10000 [Streptomyces cellostaticus]
MAGTAGPAARTPDHANGSPVPTTATAGAGGQETVQGGVEQGGMQTEPGRVGVNALGQVGLGVDGGPRPART